MIDDVTSVGWIGLGDQGAPMARAVAEAGFDLHAWARNEAAYDTLEGIPHIAHETPAHLAREVDVLAVCLNVDANVEEVLVDRGALAALPRGAIVVNHGTGLPAYAEHLTALAVPHGVAVLDAPVSGGRAAAVTKSLTTMVGGPDPAFDAAVTVFESFSTRVAHVGGAGAGQMTKLLNNALLMANQDNLRHLIALADSLRVDVEQLAGVIRAGTGTSRALESLGSAITPDNAEHLKEMQVVDMDIFADAVADVAEVAAPFTARAYAGAEALPLLARRIG